VFESSIHEHYVVRVSKRRPHWAVEQRVEWPTRSTAKIVPIRHERRSPDYFGLFLIALFCIVCFFAALSARTKLESQQEEKRVIHQPNGRTVAVPKRIDDPDD
jgi:hypothetical protein